MRETVRETFETGMSVQVCPCKRPYWRYRKDSMRNPSTGTLTESRGRSRKTEERSEQHEHQLATATLLPPCPASPGRLQRGSRLFYRDVGRSQRTGRRVASVDSTERTGTSRRYSRSNQSPTLERRRKRIFVEVRNSRPLPFLVLVFFGPSAFLIPGLARSIYRLFPNLFIGLLPPVIVSPGRPAVGVSRPLWTWRRRNIFGFYFHIRITGQ